MFYNNSRCKQAHASVQLAAFLYKAGSLGTSTVRSSTALGIGDGMSAPSFVAMLTIRRYSAQVLSPRCYRVDIAGPDGTCLATGASNERGQGHHS